MPRPKEDVLNELAQVAEELRRAEVMAKRRDELVIEATRAEASRSEVGRAAGVSRGRVQQIVTEARRKQRMKGRGRQAGLAVVVLTAGIGAAAALSSGDESDPATDAASRPAFVSAASVKAEFAASGGSKAEWIVMHPGLWSRQIEMICDVSPAHARRYERQLGPTFRASVLERLRSDCST